MTKIVFEKLIKESCMAKLDDEIKGKILFYLAIFIIFFGYLGSLWLKQKGYF